MEELKRKIVAVVEPILAGQKSELADMALSIYRKNLTIRLFVYAEGGVTIERCAELSRIIRDILDGTDLLPDGYLLEVSSPGLDRPLTAIRDFRYRIGEKVKIGFCDSKRKKVTAEIVSASDNAVRFRNDGGEFEVVMDEIEAAKILF